MKSQKYAAVVTNDREQFDPKKRFDKHTQLDDSLSRGDGWEGQCEPREQLASHPFLWETASEKGWK